MDFERENSPEIRYGIIGCGMMGCEHIMNINLIANARVVAVADPDRTSRSWAKSIAPDGVEYFTDYRDLLKLKTIDVVVIATPNFSHFDILRDVLPTGKHIMVEKPLVTEVEHCQPLLEASQRCDSLVWVGMEYRYMQAVACLIESVHQGDVGDLYMLNIREHRFPFLKKVNDWNRFNRNTGGTLVEKCCHFFDLMNTIFATHPKKVYASGAQSVNHLDESYDGETPDIIDNAFTIVDFEGGGRGMLDLCMFAENSPS